MRGIFVALLIMNVLYFVNYLFFVESDNQQSERDGQYTDNPYPSAEEIVILGEQTETARAKLPLDQTEQLLQQPICSAIGPFQSIEKLREFEAQWVANEPNMKIKLTKLAKFGKEEYVVKADLKNSPGSALYEIQRLQSIGYNGYLVVGSEESEIVVGKYESLDKAKSTVQRIKPLALEVSISKERLKEQQYWVKVVDTKKPSELSALLKPYFNQFNGIILSQSSCE